MVTTMEIARTPEIQPDRDGGKRWPSGRRRGALPPRKPRPAETAPPTPEPGAGDAQATPPADAPAHHVDVTV
jgi:hypothetical protein